MSMKGKIAVVTGGSRGLGLSVVWETDLKAGLYWLQAALGVPLKPGSRVLVGSSGAAATGSEGREVIAVFEGGRHPTPSCFMWLEWHNDKITFIRDYRYVRYVASDAELVWRELPPA